MIMSTWKQKISVGITQSGGKKATSKAYIPYDFIEKAFSEGQNYNAREQIRK